MKFKTESLEKLKASLSCLVDDNAGTSSVENFEMQSTCGEYFYVDVDAEAKGDPDSSITEFSNIVISICDSESEFVTGNQEKDFMAQINSCLLDISI